jgi:hypothetical protein
MRGGASWESHRLWAYKLLRKVFFVNTHAVKLITLMFHELH